MALLGNLLGTVDGLLGGAAGSARGSARTDTSHTLDLGGLVETSPSVGVNALGLADVSVSAPTAVGVTADVGHLNLSGLLHGLL